MSKTNSKEYQVEQLNHGRRVFDFLSLGKPAFIITVLLVIFSIAVVFVKGFNKGLDFTGGTSIEIQLSKNVELSEVKKALVDGGLTDALVQNFGSSVDLLVRVPPIEGRDGNTLGTRITEQLHKEVDANAVIKRVEFVGPSVGNELAQDGILAILASLVCILIYIAMRFEWRFGVGAVVGLLFDILIVVGYLSIFKRELDLTIVAALLSIIGYSLNDTIVVFDRVRENFRKIRRGSSYDIINISLTQTLSRTLMTSATTLAVVICLYILGGSILRGFSETLAIGIILGTLSTIYVATYTTYLLGVKREHLLPPKDEE